MAIQGKKSISIRRQSLSSERAMAVGAVKILPFAHESTAGGESDIDLSSLVLPSGITTPNPSSIDFQRAKLLFNKDALILISDTKGRLIREVDYNITSNTKITFTDTFGTTVVGERFFGYINPVVSSETLVADVNPIVETGELGIGSVEINIGKSFNVNANSATQQGEVAVFIDGQLFLRNIGNSTATPGSPDGDYEEVDSGDGTSVQIKLNDSSPSARAYTVISTALSTIRPDASILTEVERQAGVIDSLVEHVALLAGVPESNLGQATPTQPQLKTFSERVIALEVKNKWQTKKLTANVTTDGNFTAADANFVFNNLEIGKTYRVFLQANIVAAATDTATAQIYHNGAVIAECKGKGGASASINTTVSTDAIVTATTTTIDFIALSLSGSTINGNNTFSLTWARIEELDDYDTETTDFT